MISLRSADTSTAKAVTLTAGTSKAALTRLFKTTGMACALTLVAASAVRAQDADDQQPEMSFEHKLIDGLLRGIGGENMRATADISWKRKYIDPIGQTWTRLGLQVAIEAVPGTVFFGQASTQKYSAFIAQYGTEDAMVGPRALIHTVDPARGFGGNRPRRVRAGRPGRLRRRQDHSAI